MRTGGGNGGAPSAPPLDSTNGSNGYGTVDTLQSETRRKRGFLDALPLDYTELVAFKVG